MPVCNHQIFRNAEPALWKLHSLYDSRKNKKRMLFSERFLLALVRKLASGTSHSSSSSRRDKGETVSRFWLKRVRPRRRCRAGVFRDGGAFFYNALRRHQSAPRRRTTRRIDGSCRDDIVWRRFSLLKKKNARPVSVLSLSLLMTSPAESSRAYFPTIL